MGLIRACLRFILWTVGVVVAVVALAVALAASRPSWDHSPMQHVFSVAICLADGQLPPALAGHGRMSGPPGPVPAAMEAASVDLPRLALQGSGDQMPQLGLGMCCRPAAYDDVLVERAVLSYLLLGGRLIDTADVYGNHAAIGRAIRAAAARGVPRSEVFVVTKVMDVGFGPTGPKKAVARFLDELGLDYVDLVLLHAPDTLFLPPWLFRNECYNQNLTGAQCREASWRALSEMRAKGAVRNIGISNYKSEHVRALLALKDVAPIATHQIQANPWSPQSTRDMIELCQKNGIQVTAYYSLGGIFQKGGATGASAVKAIAERNKVSTVNVLLRWALQRNLAIIPGTSKVHHMKDSLTNLLSFELSEEDMKTLDNLNKHDDSVSHFEL